MILKIKAKPNSKKQKIVQKENYYEVHLKSAPENNKANMELTKLLQKYFKKEIRIKSGFTSKNKFIEIRE